MFLRKAKRREPVPITMSGVRMGERLLQLGLDDPTIAAALAAKVGLSGSATAIVVDAGQAARLHAAAAEAGALLDVQTAPLDRLPFDDDAFDVVVIHAATGLLDSLDTAPRDAALRECHRVLRRGGRLVAIEPGTRSGLRSLLGRPRVNPEYQTAGGSKGALEQVGFQPVRVVGDVEGLRFVEGLRK